MKSVVISIKPKWVSLILNGKKRDEIRKSMPLQIAPPFKAYIYCTEDKPGRWLVNQYLRYLNSTVCGYFICDKITPISSPFGGKEAESELTAKEMYQYAAGNDTLYDWHISEAHMYIAPTSLKCLGLKRPPQSWQYVSK